MPSNQSIILPCIEKEPQNTATHSTIWLHGLGADGNDFAPIVTELDSTITKNMRFIFPHAPIMPVTINGGYEMRAWFDIHGVRLEDKVDINGMKQSIAQVEQLILREIHRGIPAEKIFLAGFSQGAVIALMTGLQYQLPLAGIIALSGYLPFAEEVFATRSAANKQIAIFLAHGTQDPIVPFALGQATLATLQSVNYPVRWHAYPMQHSVCAEEIDNISDWMLEKMHG